MTKKKKLKSSQAGNRENANKNVDEQMLRKMTRETVDRGHKLGRAIMGVVETASDSTAGMAEAAIGLAIAWAALKHIADDMGIDEVKTLFDNEVKRYERHFTMLDKEMGV